MRKRRKKNEKKKDRAYVIFTNYRSRIIPKTILAAILLFLDIESIPYKRKKQFFLKK